MRVENVWGCFWCSMYKKNLIASEGTKVIYKSADASRFISGLNNTTGNDLETSTDKGRVPQSMENIKEDSSTGRAAMPVDVTPEVEKFGQFPLIPFDR